MRAELIRPVAELLHKHARERGGVVAYDDGARRVTWSELATSTGRLAGHLRALGCLPGERVMVCLGNRVEAVEACLAANRAHLVAVPVDARSGPAGLGHMLRDSGATTVIVDAWRHGDFDPASGVRFLVVTDGAEVPETAHDYDALRASDPDVPAADDLGLDEPAWMLYTSGTTGEPKGVVSTERAAMWSVAAGYAAVLGIDESDRLVWPLPLHHSFAFNLAVLGAVGTGASVSILGEFAPDEIAARLATEPCTVLATVPTVCRYLLDLADEVDLGSLRACLVAGAATSGALNRQFEETFGVPLIDSYGSTETTGVITCNTVEGPKVPGSCGREVPGVRLRLVDPDTGVDVAENTEGEIWVDSPSLMLGYHDDAEATSAVLLSGWYRTGDLGRRDAGGFLTITGRRREMILRGGENIHPTEVEDVIRTCPAVADVAVVSRAHSAVGEVPVAYVVPQSGEVVDTDAVLAACRDRLAPYKVPAELHLCETLPRTPSGKVVRRLVADRPARLVATAGPHHLAILRPDGTPVPASATSVVSPIAGLDLVLSGPATISEVHALAEHLRTAHGATVSEAEDEMLSLRGPGVQLLLTPRPGVGIRELRSGVDAALTAGEPTVLVLPFGLEPTRAMDSMRPDPELAAAVADDLRAGRVRLLDIVLTELAALLGRDVQEHPGKPLSALGLDSAGTLNLRARLSARTGLSLPASLAFDHPTPAALAGALRTRLSGEQDVAVPEREHLHDDPIVVVGMACRYPGGVRSADDLWQLIVDGRDVLGPFPTDRGWDLNTLFGEGDGTSHTRVGGFLSDVANFDASFFGISPREALATDPQQRLLLEVSWDLFEQAGVDPSRLRGTPTGVFVGAMYHDYGPLLMGEDGVDGYLSTGTGGSVLSGRLAYFHGFEGPAVTVDTACSSSLVSLHLAAAALRKGECSLAVAGGVAVMATPTSFVDFSRQNGLAPDGRCKSFSADADGTGWSEGVGLLLLERLSDAHRNGHEVLAVIRGSAVNQDGTSNGLSAPNGTAQRRVIRSALADAGLSTSDVDLVEAHGTGTALGDPVEAQALIDTYGRNRETPLWLGSVKSNLGHTQAAAGIAGVIKVVQAMRHGVLPSTLHVDQPTTHVDWAGVELLTTARDWTATEPRRAAVSSFGISGTNAHVIFEEGEPVVEVPRAPVGPWLLSAATPDALAVRVADLQSWLANHPGADNASVARTLDGFAALEHRAAAPAGELARLTTGRAGSGGLALLFTGQGSQRRRMGEQLRAAFPVFDAAWGEVTALLPIPDLDPSATEYAQPALFALQVALFRLYRSWGVQPEVLIGHSIGELAAAHVSGVLTLPDAARLVRARAELMGALPAGGAMVAVRASETEVLPLLNNRVALAAVNGPNAVVLSGDEDAVLAIAGRFSRTRRLAVSHAFHSPLMDPMLDEFRRVARDLTYHSPTIPIVTTGAANGDVTSPEYWVQQVREPVRFSSALASVAGAGVRVYLELGPDPVLSAAGADVTDSGVFAAALRSGHDETVTTTAVLGELFCAGIPFDRVAVNGTGPRVTLPPYPFDHRRYWPRDTVRPPVRLAHVVRWEQTTYPRTTPDGLWLALGDGPVVSVLVEHGLDVCVLSPNPTPAELAASSPSGVVITSDGDPARVLAALQALAAAQVTAAVWIITGDSTEHGDAQVWGLGRVAAMEAVVPRCGLIEMGKGADPAALLAVLSGNLAEDEVSVRRDGVFVRRLLPAAWPFTAPRWTPRGTVLVTGGTGALGRHVARGLIEAGAVHVLLVSRSGVTDDLGPSVSSAACDVTDERGMAQLIAGIPPDRPLTAVVHAAGVLDDGVLTSLTAERLTRVAAAKAGGALVLDRITRDIDLDAFVLFSSFAGVVGAAGQANYAAANAALDALAERRRRAGLPATSIAWGAWGGGGMAESLAGQLADRGMRPMDPRTAYRALEMAVSRPDPSVLVADVDWDLFSGLRPLLRSLQTPTRQAEPAIQRIETHTEAELVAMVREHAATLLRYSSSADIDPGRSFRDLGFDSLAAVELRARLVAATGLSLPTSVVFDHPSVAALATHLAGHRVDDDDSTTPASADEDPVVIVGTACRFPGGVRTADDLWDLVYTGRDAVGPFPNDRGWDLDNLFADDPDIAGTTYTRQGGFLDGATEFDADFFGISPREALATDPQHRLLLETSWELFENAGITLASQRGQSVGVFIGSNGQDYTTLIGRSAEQLEGYLGVGGAASVASGRISYFHGFTGPALTVDTACSSALVAMDLATTALRRGDCALALAGGVTIMSTPDAFVDFGRQRGLAPDGRCKAFAAAADGTGWAEGVGMVLLERLSDARRHGHRVLAVVRGSAVNQDGASNGLSAPNGTAQRRVIRGALSEAGLSSADVDVVEAHGTGTRLGDPIEAEALLTTYGQDRDRPVLVGSVKSNLGHTQAAAGIAGVIKMVQAMHHGVVPATLHVDQPSPLIDWDRGAMRLVTEATAWPETGRPRRAAVSSFGISGTNAHVILEQAPMRAATTPPEPDIVVPWVVSAASADALADRIDTLSTVCSDPVKVARTIAMGRDTLAHRAVLLSTGGSSTSVQAPASGGLAFAFTGQGGQWPGMAGELHHAFPVFADAFDEASAALDEPLLNIVATNAVHDTRFTQPALFALEVALYRLITSWGVHPDYLIGHSVGEIVAAHVSGALSLTDAATLVSARARLMADLPTGGAMASIAAAESVVITAIADRTDIAVAAVNGPRAVVVSGSAAAVDEVISSLTDSGHRIRRLSVSHAFHSPLVDPVLPQLDAVAEGLNWHDPVIPVVSTLTGQTADFAARGRWSRHARAAVRFADGVDSLVAAGVTRFLEVGPDTVLSSAVRGAYPDTGAVSLMRRNRDATATVATALGTLHAWDVKVNWTAYLGDGDRATLPPYPFRTARYWPRPTPTGRRGDHPVLADVVERADTGDRVWTGVVSTRTHPWLADHVVGGQVLMPATAYVDIALYVGSRTGLPTVRELTVLAPLTLSAGAGVNLQVVATENQLEMFARIGTQPWTKQAVAELAAAESTPEADEWTTDGAESLDIGEAFERAAAAGFEYGPAFRGATALWRSGEELLAEVVLPSGEHPGGFAIHPAVLDAALHVCFADHGGSTGLPFVWEQVALHAPVPARLRIRVRRLAADALSVWVTDESGHPVLTAGALRLREVRRTGTLYDRVLVPPEIGPSRDVLLHVVEPSTPDDVAAMPTQALELAWRTACVLREHDDHLPLAVVVTGDGPGSHVLRSLVRAAHAEYPGRFILIDTDGDPARVSAVVPVDAAEIVVRSGRPLVPTWTPRTIDAPTAAVPGTTLITGATGGIGAAVARHLAAHGTTDLLLVSRTGEDRGLLGELTGLGANARIVACDVADAEALARVLDGERITSVYHAAGIVDDGLFEDLTRERLERVMAVKAVGAVALHRATLDHDVRRFVLFSSAASALGSPAQANYAAANGFLDGFAVYRQSLGLPAVSIQWGPWDVGMVSRLDASSLERMRRHGTEPVEVGEGLAMLDAVLADDKGPSTVLAARLAPISRPRRDDTPAPEKPRLEGLPTSRRKGVLANLVREHTAAVLGHTDSGLIPVDSPFQELGLDSLAAVELRNRLAAGTGVTLSPTLVFDHPSPSAVVNHLERLLTPPVGEAVRSRIQALEDDIRSADLDLTTTAELGARLRALLSSLGEASNDIDDDVADISDEELFDVLDREIGAVEPAEEQGE